MTNSLFTGVSSKVRKLILATMRFNCYRIFLALTGPLGATAVRTPSALGEFICFLHRNPATASLTVDSRKTLNFHLVEFIFP